MTRQELSASILDSIVQADSVFTGACAFSFYAKSLYVMCGFEDDPLSVVKGLRINDEWENDHRNELLKMQSFAEILAHPFS